MADHYLNNLTRRNQRPIAEPPFLLRKLQQHASSSKQLFGLFTLLITATVLLVLAGITVVTTFLCFILFLPLIILSSPIWVPAFAVLFVLTAGFVFVCGFGLVAVGVLTWVYRYFRGTRPRGSDRVGYAPMVRIYDTGRYVKEFGGQRSKVVDTAPGA